MAGLYGDFVARTINQKPIVVSSGSWTALQCAGTPQKGRRHIRYQIRGTGGATLALEYVSQNADGTYTTPTKAPGNSAFLPGNATVIEPIGDNITVFGRVVFRAGATTQEGGVIVTEFS